MARVLHNALFWVFMASVAWVAAVTVVIATQP
jgi:hypothetical protein